MDTRAGLPQGTCSYHFPTRNALLTAALERMADLDLAESSTDADFASVLAAWVTTEATRTRARFMLMLDPQARADLGVVATRVASSFVERATALLGSQQQARLLLALLDGLLLDELTRGTLTDEERRRRLDVVHKIVTVDR